MRRAPCHRQRPALDSHPPPGLARLRTVCAAAAALCLWLPLLLAVAGEPETVTADLDAASGTITVTGRAAEEPFAENARSDAVARALQRIAGRKLTSLVPAEHHQRIYADLIGKKDAFIVEYQPVGSAKTKDGKHYQKYKLTVIPYLIDRCVYESILKLDEDGALKICNLYQKMEKLRLAVAIRGIAVSEAGEETFQDPDAHAENTIKEFFKSKEANFDFISLEGLGGSAWEKPDWVRLLRENRYDLVITGTVRTSLLKKIPRVIAGLDEDGDVALTVYRCCTEADWKIISVARSRWVGGVHVRHDKGSETCLSMSQGTEWARRHALEQATPQLFFKLIREWIRTVYSPEYTISFRGVPAEQNGTILEALASLPTLVPNRIAFRGIIDKALAYDVVVKGTLTTFMQDLQTRLGEYRVEESRWGKVTLAPRAGAQEQIWLKIADCSYTQCLQIRSKLENLQDVASVGDPEFEGGNALFVVQSKRPCPEFVQAIEKLVKDLRVTGVRGNHVEAKPQKEE